MRPRRGKIDETRGRFEPSLSQDSASAPRRWNDADIEGFRRRNAQRLPHGRCLVLNRSQLGQQRDARPEASNRFAKCSGRRGCAVDDAESLLNGQTTFGAGVVETVAERPIRAGPLPRRRGERIAAPAGYAEHPSRRRNCDEGCRLHQGYPEARNALAAASASRCRPSAMASAGEASSR